ncbi:hypothetical protein BVRB_1g004660 [Beta vulgaris subsp. vulgaris]|nr:hypothetical protein BVRB_1g004660 [Beta vulgaris subsp. vulgaris]
MHEFNSLSDSTKASYIAEAKIRNSVENNTWPTEKLFKPMKSAKPRKSRRDRERRNKVFNTALKTMATGVFLEAMRQERLMIDPKFRPGGIAAYYEAGGRNFVLSVMKT